MWDGVGLRLRTTFFFKVFIQFVLLHDDTRPRSNFDTGNGIYTLTEVLPCCQKFRLFQQQKKCPHIKPADNNLCISEVHRSSLYLSHPLKQSYPYMWTGVSRSSLARLYSRRLWRRSCDGKFGSQTDNVRYFLLMKMKPRVNTECTQFSVW